jgi:diguanylate cyclase (GGDEF)-like protein/PAS domain S-box-containing protein
MASPALNPRSAAAPLRLLYTGTALLILVLLATNAAVILHLRESELLQEEGQLTNLSLIMAEQADRSFQSVDLVISSVADGMAVGGVTDAPSFVQKMAGHDIYLFLREKLTGVPQLAAVTVINRDGKLINTSRAWPVPEADISDRDFFRVLKANANLKYSVSEPIQNRTTYTWTIYLAHRVSGANGEFLGLILGAIEMQYFEDFYRAISPSESSSIGIQRLDGVMLARFPPTDAIGKALPLQRIFHGGISGTVRERSPIDGRMRIKAAHLLPNYAVLTFATNTEEASLANWRRAAGLMSLGALGCAISIAIAGFAFGRQWRQQLTLADSQAELRRQEDRTAAMGTAVSVAQATAQQMNRYRGLLEAAPDAMVVVDQDGEIVLLNVQAEKQFGYRRDELIGQKVKNIIPEGFAERLIADDLRSAADALAQQIGTGIELTGRRKDGGEFPIEIMLSPLESAEGVLVTAAIRDISVRKNAEKHLAQMEGRYRGLLEAAPDAMVVVNQDGEIVLLNVQAEKQFGYRRDELVGQKVKNIIPEGFAERLIADGTRTAAEALAQQIGTGIELRGRRKDGSEFPIEIMLSPLESAEETLITAAIRDISVRKDAEKHLAQMEGRYRGLLEAAPDAMVVVNQDGEIVLLNVQAEKQFGYRRDELVGQKVKNIVPKGFAERLIADGSRTAAEALAQQIGTGIELTGRRKDGGEFPIEIMLSPLESAEGILVTAAIRDISVRKDAEKHLAQMEGRYRGLLEAAPDAMVVVNQDGEIVLLNVQAEKQFGYRRDELIGQKVKNIIPKGFAERLIADGTRTAAEALAQQIGTGIELRGRRKDRSEFPIEIMLSPLESAGGILVTAAIRDISVRKDMEEALFVEKELAQVTLNSIGDAVVCTDILGNITFLNLVAEKMTGWSRQEAASRPMAEVFRMLDATSREPIPDPMKKAIGQNRTGHLSSNSVLIRRDGFEIRVEDSASPIHDREGRATGAVIVFRDVSAAHEMTLQMTHSAEHDFLTGLPNRRLLNDRVNQAIALARRHMKTVAVLFLDLDGFKNINDSLGHPVGDKLLQSIGKCLVDCVRDSDTVSRQGGDEFVVLLSDAEHAEDAAITARRMLEAVAEARAIDQHDLHVTTSIGISVYPQDGRDAETLIKNADTAMYQAKENGRQSYQFFEPAMNIRAVERQSIEEGLRRALKRQEFALHYQPIVDLRTGAITGAEALIRWTHPTRGSVPPAQFIPIAEDCGLILPIGNWVLREACQQARNWVAAGLPATAVAINVSAMQFRDKNFLEGLFAILSETGLDPGSLVLELTESVLMKHAETAASILHALRERGVQVAIDYFGTGYSSLGYLRKFPLDALKIDQSFVRQISTAGEDTAIVTAVIGMAQGLKLRVIAEGVESLEELTFLRGHQCDEAQGYYFSRPVFAQQFARLLETGIPEPDSALRRSLIASVKTDA